MRTPAGAQAIVYGLILTGMKGDAGMKYMAANCDDELLLIIAEVSGSLKDLDKRKRLPLIDLALPILKALAEEQRQAFIEIIDQLVRLDKRVTLFEFVMITIIHQHLDKKSQRDNKVKYHSFKPVLNEIRILISMMTQSSRQAEDKIALVYDRAMQSFSSTGLRIVPLKDCSLKLVAEVLNKLNHLSPMLKKSLITACVDCLLEDGIVMPDEAELLRAITESIDCPMPPILQH